VDHERPWRPLSREEFRQLQRGDRLRDRGGREWIVRAAAYLDPELGEYRVVLVTGAQVGMERSDTMLRLLPDPSHAAGLSWSALITWSRTPSTDVSHVATVNVPSAPRQAAALSSPGPITRSLPGTARCGSSRRISSRSVRGGTAPPSTPVHFNLVDPASVSFVGSHPGSLACLSVASGIIHFDLARQWPEAVGVARPLLRARGPGGQGRPADLRPGRPIHAPPLGPGRGRGRLPRHGRAGRRGRAAARGRRHDGSPDGRRADDHPCWADGRRAGAALGREQLTLLGVDDHRGVDGIKALGVLDEMTGIVIHDAWPAYWNVGFEKVSGHGLCNAHHLRELLAVTDLDGQRWSERMTNLLLEMLAKRNAAMAAGRTELEPEQVTAFEDAYDRVIREGWRENPRRAGKRQRSKAANLLRRLDEHRDEALRFLHVFAVPFTNNEIEGDLRMTKLHEKISGGWRSMEGARAFLAVRSYLATARKQGQGMLEVLTAAFEGRPWMSAAAGP
jgi:Transposase IS66 family